MTLDGWASTIARPLLYEAGLPSAAPFFISFTFVAGIVMTNVVVAILLEKYLGATADAQNRKLRAEHDERVAAEALALADDDQEAARAHAERRAHHLLNREDVIDMIQDVGRPPARCPPVHRAHAPTAHTAQRHTAQR
jgi:hypothetical protein